MQKSIYFLIYSSYSWKGQPRKVWGRHWLTSLEHLLCAGPFIFAVSLNSREMLFRGTLPWLNSHGSWVAGLGADEPHLTSHLVLTPPLCAVITLAVIATGVSHHVEHTPMGTRVQSQTPTCSTDLSWHLPWVRGQVRVGGWGGGPQRGSVILFSHISVGCFCSS